MLVIFTFISYEAISTYFMKKAWEEGEQTQSQEREKSTLLSIEELTLADTDASSYDTIRPCSDKDAIASIPAACNDEALSSDGNLMANSSLIMLSQSNRA